MPKLMVTGKCKLEGIIKISGAKNAVLPQMAASLLTKEKVILTNVPNITDVRDMITTLEAYGVAVQPDDWNKFKGTLELQAESPTSSLPSINVRTDIRASFLVFGPLLARTGKAEVYKPGGCDIQKEPRKVDYHIQAMEDMSVQENPSIKETKIFVKMEVENGLKFAAITFKKSSVGATETAMMAASLVEGDTVIRHAAIEPEIYDLAKMLKKMGAKININENVEIAEDDLTDFGIEEEVWNVITVTGRKSLRGASHRVMPDRIEFGTYAIAAAMNNGPIVLKVEFEKDIEEDMKEDMKEAMLKAIRKPLKDAGVNIKEIKKRHQYEIEISLNKNRIIKPFDIKTGPYPDFPTDLLPLWVAFMTQAQPTKMQTGETKIYSTVHDRIYDDRFKYVDGLVAMKAQIEKVSDKEYRIFAGKALYGTHVRATDLRGGAALVLAGLVVQDDAESSTVVHNFQHIQRGYEDMVEKLSGCGAKLQILDDARDGHYGGTGAF